MALLSVVQQFGEKWQLLGDLQYTNWSTIGTVNVINTNTGATADRLALNFDNAWRIALGVNYFSSEKWTFRGGVGVGPVARQRPEPYRALAGQRPLSGSRWARSTSSARAVRWISATRTCSCSRRTSTKPSSPTLGTVTITNNVTGELRQLGRHHRCPVDLDVLKPQEEGALAPPPLIHRSQIPMPASPPFHVRKVAVLGAGVMGAQIAAHLVNANVPAVLFELPAKEGDPNGNVRKAIDGLKKLEPSPLASAAKAAYHRGGQLRSAPGAAARVRPGDRGDRRAHGPEESRSTTRSRRTSAPQADLRQQHLRSVDQRARRRRCRKHCASASAACISSTRRATCTWSS